MQQLVSGDVEEAVVRVKRRPRERVHVLLEDASTIDARLLNPVLRDERNLHSRLQAHAERIQQRIRIVEKMVTSNAHADRVGVPVDLALSLQLVGGEHAVEKGDTLRERNNLRRTRHEVL